MKKFIWLFVITMFLANTIAVSAWAKPCIGQDSMAMSQEVTMDSDMPCHEKAEKKDTKDTTKHCDGVCLCLHVSISQTPIFSSSDSVTAPEIGYVSFFDSQNAVVSHKTSPPLRPPKLIS